MNRKQFTELTAAGQLQIFTVFPFNSEYDPETKSKPKVGYFWLTVALFNGYCLLLYDFTVNGLIRYWNWFISK